jgi:5'-nucleotidase/UDP-sugar diphosphatase
MKKYFFSLIVLVFSMCNLTANEVRILFSGSTLGRSLKFIDDQGENQAGYPARKTLIDELKSNSDNNIILVDTGNFVSEYYMSAFTDYVPDYTAMNTIGYDVSGIGFNEINRTFSSFNNLYKKSSFQMINCNVKTLKGKKIANPYFIKSVNGVKVGFVSVINENTYLALSKEAKESITIEDPVVVLEKVLQDMKNKEKVDVIVALTNVDYYSDLKSGAGFLASLFPSIDLIIEGSYGANKNKIFNVNGSRIYTIEKNGMYLGDVTFKIAKKGTTGEKNQINIVSEQFYPINVHVNGRSISQQIPEDKKLLQKLEKLTEKVNKKLSIASANVTATNFSSIGKMDNFTKLCCIATDALRVGTQADVAFLNAGLFKEVDLSKNKTLGYTFASDILKYDNNAVIVNLRGDELKNIVEYSMIRRGYGQFLIFSGMEVVYSAKDKKVTDMRIYKKKVVDDKIYKIAVSDFLANGGDTYYFFEREKNKIYTYIPIEKLINDYVSKINSIMNDTIDMKRLEITE